jgi:hypothetical protein
MATLRARLTGVDGKLGRHVMTAVLGKGTAR